VEFVGGSVLGAVVCKSQPSTSRLSLPAETRVMFVNRLGEPGTLRIDGRNVAPVGANQGVPVVFHSGPVSVSMAFPCNLGVVQQYESVAVAIAPKTANPGPVGQVNSAAPAGSAETGTGTVRTDRPAAGDQEGGTQTEPVGPEEIEPDGSLSGSDAFVPPVAANSTNNLPAADVEHPVPVAGTPRNRASNLLALIATIGVLGVTIAAIRAIVSQRTRRIQFA
jgi:hypothetical protein